jgi:hypothetical protein
VVHLYVTGAGGRNRDNSARRHAEDRDHLERERERQDDDRAAAGRAAWRVQFVELDALVHGAGWIETPDDVLGSRLEPIIASDGSVIDGAYQHKLGKLVVGAADTVVWLDVPIRVWFPRLLRRTARRMCRREELCNGNRESIKAAMGGRESLLVWAVRSHYRNRRRWPQELRGLPV